MSGVVRKVVMLCGKGEGVSNSGGGTRRRRQDAQSHTDKHGEDLRVQNAGVQSDVEDD